MKWNNVLEIVRVLENEEGCDSNQCDYISFYYFFLYDDEMLLTANCYKFVCALYRYLFNISIDCSLNFIKKIIM